MAEEVINQFKDINGSDVFDRQVDSEGKATKKTKKEGTRARPFNVGLFQEVKDVSWGLGEFSYAGFTVEGLTVAGGLVKTSDDGVGWQSSSASFGTDTQFRVSIGGFEPTGSDQSGSPVLLVGGSRFIQTGSLPSGTPIGYFEPILGADFGNGVSRVSLVTAAAQDNDGFVDAVGYDPKTKLFYASATFNGPASRITYVGTPNTGFGEFGSGNAGSFPPVPEKIKLCDANGGSRSDIRFVSSFSKEQIIKSTDGDGNSVEFNLFSVGAPADKPMCICGRRGIMVILCHPDVGGLEGPVQAFVSTNNGGGWGFAFDSGGALEGSVSFS